MSFLELENIEVGYGKNNIILKGFSLSIEKGEFISLLGPSGCGKTTTLRAIAGFLPILGGKLLLNDKIYNNVPPHKRNMGFVFQNYALFPHLSIFENVAFGLKMRGFPQDKIREKVYGVLSFVGLSGYENRFPSELSGGQQQRVAIARAIVIEPDLLLMDEPLSNLDAKLRVEMRGELARMQRDLEITTVYVTHDQAEALALSDRVAVMNAGRIEQYDTPERLYHNPKTVFVAQFMGFESFFMGKVVEIQEGFVIVEGGDGEKVKGRGVEKLKLGESVEVFTRASYLTLSDKKTPLSLSGKLISRIFQGETVLYIVKRDILINIEVPVDKAVWKEGRDLYIVYNPEYLLIFKRD